APNDYASIIQNEDKNFCRKSAGFMKGGQYILRNEELHFFIDAGELGKDTAGAHIDIFSFELFYKGKKMISDPGTFSYYNHNELRNKLRSDISHNIFCIDDEPISVPVGSFGINDDLTKPKILEWESSDAEDILAAQHYAYTRLPDPVICKRIFHFFKGKRLIKIKDEFFGGKKHKAVFNITFHPGVELIQNSITEYTAVSENTIIKIRFHSSAEYFFSSIQEAVYSEEYGTLAKTKRIFTVSEEKFPFFMVTDIELL
ncbi:MAG TPA: heparinase II/III-family protein, partial [Ignavibacteriaceae bacterium]|nr:heparinase II/III-family protein [Ignavibacteriaceae bacterium]